MDLNISCTSNLGYQDYQKKAQTRQVAQITQQKPFFNTINPSCFSFQCPKVLTNPSKENNYLQVNQVQAGTSDYKSHPNCILVCTATVWMTRWVFTSKSTWVKFVQENIGH